jgi:hypothetical protein
MRCESIFESIKIIGLYAEHELWYFLDFVTVLELAQIERRVFKLCGDFIFRAAADNYYGKSPKNLQELAICQPNGPPQLS